MKIDTNVNQIERSAIQSTKEFTMRADSHMFRMLIKQYVDAPYASMREIFVNGVDSHIEAGKKDTPIEVTLPSFLNPIVKCKDFGVGMSKATIENLYSEAGNSSKNHTNNLTGGYGIGRLSVLAYTNQFSLVSNYNGEKHTYIVALNQANIPELNYIGTAKTSESNGVEVSWGVKSTDINLFTDKAKRVLKNIRPRPIIKGATVNFSDIKYLYETSDFSIEEANNATTVVMGSISY